ncbi:hypothetical protein M0R45_006164 [Rubus argutus]|uniref:Agglutinin domain-containing protein n=1 Tax=Rubus argutus TaxID=59490 RepID=A0AAW1YQ86_RUBAR
MYLVRYTGAFGTNCSSRWIVAAADEPEENKSKISCTLFKLERVNISEGLEFRFRHIQLDKHACLWTCSDPNHRKNFGGLHGGSPAPDKDKFNVYTLVAWESLVNKMNKVAMVPRFVALKLMYNRKYLSITENDPRLPAWFLKCNGEEVVSPLAKFEVEMANNENGLVHIRCCYNNKYLVAANTPTGSGCCSDKYWIHYKKNTLQQHEFNNKP